MTNVITNLLDLMRVQSTAYIAKNLTAPWGVHIDEYPDLARFHFVVSGETWIGMPGDGEAHKLTKGDIAIIPRGKAHTYFDAERPRGGKPKNYPIVGRPPYFERFHRDSDDTHLLCGYFEISEDAPAAIVARLPEVMIGRRSDDPAARKSDL